MKFQWTCWNATQIHGSIIILLSNICYPSSFSSSLLLRFLCFAFFLSAFHRAQTSIVCTILELIRFYCWFEIYDISTKTTQRFYNKYWIVWILLKRKNTLADFGDPQPNVNWDIGGRTHWNIVHVWNCDRCRAKWIYSLGRIMNHFRLMNGFIEIARLKMRLKWRSYSWECHGQPLSRHGLYGCHSIFSGLSICENIVQIILQRLCCLVG